LETICGWKEGKMNSLLAVIDGILMLTFSYLAFQAYKHPDFGGMEEMLPEEMLPPSLNIQKIAMGVYGGFAIIFAMNMGAVLN
jgi:hypothetical protein